MAQTRVKRCKFFILQAFLVFLFIAQCECGRSGGGSRSSGGSHSSSSHSSSSHSSSSHTSHSSPSHTSYGGGSHTSFGGSTHSSSGSHSTFGGGSPHTSFGSSSSGSHLPSSGTHSTYGGGSPHTSFGSSSSGSHLPPSGTHPTYGGGSPHTSFGSSSSGSSHLPPSGTPHTSFGGGSHISPPSTFGSGSHPNPPNNHFGPSAPSLPGYTVTGGSAFIPHSSAGVKPIGFDHVNQQAAHNTPNVGGSITPQHTHPLQSGPPGYTVTGGTPVANKPGIGFEHVNQQTHNSGFPQHPNTPGGVPLPNKPATGIGFDHVNQQTHNSGFPQHPNTPGGVPLPNKPATGIGFDHVNQQSHTNVNSGIPPPSGGTLGFQHPNQAHLPQSGSPGYTPTAPYPQPPVYTGSRSGIGFDHVNSQAGMHHTAPTYQPYRPQTVVQPSGYVHYQPPVQLQYTPPVTVHHTTTHYVPVYQPSVIHTYSGSSGLGGSVLSHGGAFLGGYLVGRLSSPSYGHSHFNDGYHNTHITNNYYNNDRPGTTNNYYNDNTGSSGGGNGGGGNNYNSFYTVHHYHQNPEAVPKRFTVPGEELSQCQTNTTDQLCVPNTNALCLKNGTIMCTTPSMFTTPCGLNSTDSCVYSRIECNGNPACNLSANQTYVDFYLPCISNVTYVDNKVLYNNDYKTQGSYELCVTAVAHPKRLDSPLIALASLITEFSQWHLDELRNIKNNSTNSGKR